MTQAQQVLEAIKKLGGKGTTNEICRKIKNIDKWGSKTPKASVSSILSRGDKYIQEGKIWIYDENNSSKNTTGNSTKRILLNCTDGVMPTAIAKKSGKKWTIYGVEKSTIHGSGNADYEKALFDTTFDDIIPFNSMSGISYIAVKKVKLWGLVRFRQNPEYAFSKAAYKHVIKNEPIDERFTDVLGREIKLIEEIIFPDINNLMKKYNLENPNVPDNSSKKAKKKKI